MRVPDPLELELATLLASDPGDAPPLMPALRAAERALGHVSDETLREIAGRVGVSEEDARNLCAYFGPRREKPPARHVVEVCVNVSCRRRGGEAVLERWRERLGIEVGEVTADGEVALREVVCFKACDFGPNVAIDGEVHGGTTLAGVDEMLASLRRSAGD
jgi:NADH:ubiquinone oxidoreductase subunit E